jgi:hypothetical protein
MMFLIISENIFAVCLEFLYTYEGDRLAKEE